MFQLASALETSFFVSVFHGISQYDVSVDLLLVEVCCECNLHKNTMQNKDESLVYARFMEEAIISVPASVYKVATVALQKLSQLLSECIFCACV